MFVAEAEVEGKAGVGEDIADSQAGGGAGEFLVDFGAVGVDERVAVGVEFLDVGGADAIAAEGFDIEARAAVIQRMTIAEEEGNEDVMGLAGSEIIQSCFDADLVPFGNREADVEVGAETGGGLSFYK